MPSHLDRARLLYHQSRFDMAEQEVRQALVERPNDEQAHALLALCLMRQDKLPEAQAEVEQAILLSPDEPFPHYCRAIVMEHRQRFPQAQESIQEALRISPDNPDYWAQSALIQFRQRDWQAALDACLQGLKYDAEHAGCDNIRSAALTNLGRKAEAISTVDASLARDPDDEMAHANKGWALLHQGKPKEALEHFREALRLDPNYAYAQHGIVEALKARNPIYRWMLAYFLWMARLSDRARWGVILGGYFGYRFLNSVATNNESLAPWITPILVLYMLFVLLTWFSVPFFNLLLRFNKFGRYALSKDQRTSSNWFAACVLGVVGGVGAGLWTGDAMWLLAALYAGGLALPLTTRYYFDPGWPRQVMTMLAVGMALVALVDLASRAAGYEPGVKFLSVFVLGIVASPWLANYLAGVNVAR